MLDISPRVDASGASGLLSIEFHPDFARTPELFASYTRIGGTVMTARVGKFNSLDAGRTFESAEVVLLEVDMASDMHVNTDLAFGPDGMLFVTLGERSDAPMRPQVQRLDSHMGKILRINPDGSVPKDNPFVGQSGALPEIWTLGHRNIQSAAFDAQGRLWEVEHGANGGDELNLVEKGKNYGWPVVAYGEEYSGLPIPNAVTAREGFEQPVYYWDPVIAPSGMQFYTGDAFPAWKGSLFIGGMRAQSLVRLTLENDRVTGEEHLLTDRDKRVRDVRQGPDGVLYAVTDERNGELWKIAPR